MLCKTVAAHRKNRGFTISLGRLFLFSPANDLRIHTRRSRFREFVEWIYGIFVGEIWSGTVDRLELFQLLTLSAPDAVDEIIVIITQT